MQIKRLFISLALLSLGVAPMTASAQSLSCIGVSGASIFGYNGSEYEYIGSISNPFGSNSIANEFGHWGNEFSSDSMFNEFGRWGNQFGSYSATNDFSFKPPVLLDSGYRFLGFVTTNDFKTPGINPYVARACAENSFSSAISDHEDFVFDDLDDLDSISSGSSNSLTTEAYWQLLCSASFGPYAIWDGGSSCYCAAGYKWNAEGTSCVASVTSCPANSTVLNNACYCNEGYVLRGGSCVTYTQACTQSYGPNVFGLKADTQDTANCYCNTGYLWNSDKTSCVAVVSNPVVGSVSHDFNPNDEQLSATTINQDKNLALATVGATCQSGTLIKASGPAVYYCGGDGKRYVFPGEKIYKTWYNDFSSVMTISDEDLAATPIGGNVTYRPGTRMVKITSSPQVYVVGKGGVLRAVPSEQTAVDLYGSTWNKQIDDIEEAYFVNYRIGAPVN